MLIDQQSHREVINRGFMIVIVGKFSAGQRVFFYDYGQWTEALLYQVLIQGIITTWVAKLTMSAERGPINTFAITVITTTQI